MTKKTKIKEIESLLTKNNNDATLKELGFSDTQIAKIKAHQKEVGCFSIPIEAWLDLRQQARKNVTKTPK